MYGIKNKEKMKNVAYNFSAARARLFLQIHALLMTNTRKSINLLLKSCICHFFFVILHAKQLCVHERMYMRVKARY